MDINRDQVTKRIEEISRQVAAEGKSNDGTFPLDVYARLQEEAPEVLEYLHETRPGVDEYQALKWYIHDFGFDVS